MQSTIGRRTLSYASASVFKIVLAVVTLPLMTNRLDAADYGVFALAGSVAAVLGILPSVGSSVAMARGFHGSTFEERRDFMSSYLLLLNIIGVVVAVAFVLLWGEISHWLSSEPVDLKLLSLVCVGLSVYSAGWAVLTSESLMLDGQAGKFAAVSVIRDFTGATVSLAGLYLLGLGLQSLFLGLGASAAMDFLMGIWALRRYMGGKISWTCIRSILRELHLTAVQIADTGARSFERILISRNVGLTALGIISHSQTYETVSLAFIKSLVRSIWPENLNEARDVNSKFPAARTATEIIGVVSLCGAILLGTVGYDIIGLLTHEKFNQAAYFAAVWVANIALTATGLGPKAVAVASGRAYLMSVGMIASRLVSLGALLLLIGWIQEAAIAVAAILAAVTMKIVMYAGILRFRNVPFQDGRAILCVLAAFVVILTSMYWAHSLQARTILFVVCGLLIAYLNRDIARMLMQKLSFA